jgi:nicotinamidase-related amidase
MSSLDDPRKKEIAEILAQPRPGVQTQQALVILGLQNDFISPEGKLPVSTENGFVDRIKEIVPKFRHLVGDVIWVRSEFNAESSAKAGFETGEVILDDVDPLGEDFTEPASSEATPKEPTPPATPTTTSRPKSSQSKTKKAMNMIKQMGKQKRKQAVVPDSAALVPEDLAREEEELFLAPSKRGPCCVPDTTGADFPHDIQDAVDATDTVIIKSHYSAFNGTSLLVSLRMKLITELYICGCMSNVSVYATTLDAASHGFTINIIEDCLGYRTASRHETALNTMVEHMGVRMITSAKILEDLNAPLEDMPQRQPPQDGSGDLLGKLLGGLTLQDATKSPGKSPSHDTSIEGLTESLEAVKIGSGKKKSKSKSKSKAKAAQSSEQSTKDEQETIETPLKSLRPQRSRSEVAPGYVKSRIRVRPKDKPLGVASESSSLDQKAPSQGAESVAAEKQVASNSPQKNVAESPSKNDSAAAAPLDSSPRNQTTISLEEPQTAPVKLSNETRNKLEEKTESSTLSITKEPFQSASQHPKNPKPIPAIKTPTRPTSTVASPQIPEVYQPSRPTHSKLQETVLSQSSTSAMLNSGKRRLQSLANLPTLGPGDEIGEGDTYIRYALIPSSVTDEINDTLPLADTIFHALYHEVGDKVPRTITFHQ